MSRKENVIANLCITNDLLRTEVSSLNEQIRFLDNTIISYRKIFSIKMSLSNSCRKNSSLQNPKSQSSKKSPLFTLVYPIIFGVSRVNLFKHKQIMLNDCVQ